MKGEDSLSLRRWCRCLSAANFSALTNRLSNNRSAMTSSLPDWGKLLGLNPGSGRTEADDRAAATDRFVSQGGTRMGSQEGRRWLRNRRASIEMSGAEFRQAGHRLVDMIADLLDSMRELPVCRDQRPSRIRTRLPVGLPPSGAEPAELLEETAQLIFDNSLFNGHPRFFGYITSSAAPLGALSDLLAAAVNPNLGGWQLSPMASEIERQAVSWIAEFIGFPKDCGGLFVSGGNAANFNCFLAARAAKAPWDLRQAGLAGGAGKMLVYATDEAHTWIQKAVDLFGHGNDAIRKIPTDEVQRADVRSLRGQITRDREQGDHPFLIVASAGTVSTGAIDPVREMAAIAREHDLWLHVDGAYGGLAAALPSASPDLKALADADSVAVDPHKWLYSPLEAGCALVRHEQAMLDFLAQPQSAAAWPWSTASVAWSSRRARCYSRSTSASAGASPFICLPRRVFSGPSARPRQSAPGRYSKRRDGSANPSTIRCSRVGASGPTAS